MPVEYVILSPLSEREMKSVVEQCREAIRAWYEGHDDPGDRWGELELGGYVPEPDEAAKMVWLPDDRRASRNSKKTKLVLARLAMTKSSLTIDRPGDLEVDHLQVSILRYVLERVGEGLMQNVDTLEPVEDVLATLGEKEGVTGFGAQEEEDEGVAAVPLERPEPRAERIHDVLWAARSRPELSIDVIATLRRSPKLAQQYAMLVVEEGPLSDTRAAAALGVKVPELREVARALDEALRRLRE